jgi:2-keto-myo-inositol isomerase
MKLALNGATTMKADLATDAHAAHLAGFQLLEIWATKLRVFLKTSPVSDLNELFEQCKVKPLSVNSIEHITFRNEKDYAGIKAECEELGSIASALGCPYIVVVPGRLPEKAPSRTEIVDESVRVLRELAGIAEGHGVALAFEFLGQTDCSVQRLDLADEIVGRVARSNVGLVIDSFHFYAGGSTIEMIDALDSKRLFIFHINDAEDLPRAELLDSHRLLPGLGILPLKQMLEAFKRIGYDRVASVEIFRPEYWERDPFELAREAKEAVEKLLTVKSGGMPPS